MSQPAKRGDDTAAAVGFGAILALAAGGAGLVIAALAVGLERAWSRRDGGRSLRDAQRRDRYGDALAWLAQDRARRDAFRRKRREWWRNGAAGDPPAAPSAWERLGSWLRRRAAKTYVATQDFRTGFGEGWQAAQDTRRAGGRFRDVARTRPQRDDEQPSVEDPEAGPELPVDGEPTAVVHDDCTYCQGCDKCRPPQHGWHCSTCGIRREGFATREAAEADAAKTPCRQGQDHRTGSNAQHPGPDNQQNIQPNTSEPATGGEPTMATAVLGDTNAVVMLSHLAGIKDRLKQIDDVNDQLSKERDALEREVQEAAEFAEQTGQTSQTRQALDAAGGVATQLGQQVGAVSDSVTEADEQAEAAVDGLRPVQQAEDELTTAGADGRAVAAAGAAA